MHIYIDCTDTYLSGLNTGIQRVVRAFAEHADEALADSGVRASKVVYEVGGFREITDLARPSRHQRIQRLRRTLNAAYLATMRLLAYRASSAPGLQHFLLAHKNDFGLAYLMTWPMRLVRRLLPQKKRAVALQSRFFRAGDILFLPDGSWMHDNQQSIKEIKGLGVTVATFIHDIIPLTHPEMCHPSLTDRFGRWLSWILPNTDILVFNSNYSKTCLEKYLAEHPVACPAHQHRAVVYLGYETPKENCSIHKSDALEAVFDCTGNTYLCVGTLDPRKNHEILLNAFDLLWQKGSSSKLLLIGRSSDLCHGLTEKILRHPEFGEKLFWFNQANDNDLEIAYRRARALLFPSFVEGFGLPLVEALSYSLVVICSDIPVFREIAGDCAFYFPPNDVQALVNRIQSVDRETQVANQMAPFIWPNWHQSTRQLMNVLTQHNTAVTS